MTAPHVTNPPGETEFYPLPSRLAHFDAQTVREAARLHFGGRTVRIRVSNIFGDRPLVVSQADVALRSSGASVAAGTDRRLTFGGSASVVVPAGTRAYSDPVGLTVRAGDDLAVSLYVTGGAKPPTTWHADARATVYVSTRGNHAGDPGSAAFTGRIASFLWLDGVEVEAPAAAAAVVALGDSITDGYASAPDTNHRWPDLLADRLAARPGNTVSALNAGISGNRVLNGSGCYGDSALARLGRDVLAQAGTKYLVLLEGINDIKFSQHATTVCSTPTTDVSAAEIVAGYRRIIARAHAAGVKAFGGTLTPAGLSASSSPEAKRQAVNAWIRTGGAFDGVVDFDRLLRDPRRPNRMLREYDCGDHLHPNDAGYAAMADTVPLAWFR